MKMFWCMNCMNEIQDGQTICDKCGYDNSHVSTAEYCLKPETILRERYVVGNMLGQGGFGITYIGFDLVLNIRVAIKEYYPQAYVSRNNNVSQRVIWDPRLNTEAEIKRGRDNFLNEARQMAKIDTIPAIVRIRDTFSTNESVYIIMDYVEGVTLKKCIASNGPMNIHECIDLLTPLMIGLQKVHEYGIIHRDISPDNIMIEPDGTVRLLDLGAAANIGIGKDRQIVVKRGFSPIEQYADGGDIGPWTDVYAICATIYYCITGRVLPDAVGRASETGNSANELPFEMPPNSRLSAKNKAALVHGLELMPTGRTQSMAMLMDELDINLKTDIFSRIKNAVKKHKAAFAVSAAAVAAVTAAAIYAASAKPWIISANELGMSNSNLQNKGGFACADGKFAYYIGENEQLYIAPIESGEAKVGGDEAKAVVDAASYINVADDKIYFLRYDMENTIKMDLADGETISAPKSRICSMDHDGDNINLISDGTYISDLQYVKLSNGHEVLYFLDYSADGVPALKMLDINTGGEETISDENPVWYNINDRYIYYIKYSNGTHILVRRDIYGGRESVLDDANDYKGGIVDDTGAYMMSLADSTLYKITHDGEQTGSYVKNINSKKIGGVYIDRYALFDDMIYYVSAEDRSLHVIDPSRGEDEVVISGETPEYLCFSDDYMWISDVSPSGGSVKRLYASLIKKNDEKRVDIFTTGWKNNIMAKNSTSGVFSNNSIEPETVESVTFLSDLSEMPDGAWDVSDAQDGSVMAWTVKKEGNRNDVYVGANGGINGRLAAKGLFRGFSSMTRISFGRSFHTDETEDFSYMFSNCDRLKTVDTKSLVTSKGKNFQDMFYSCDDITNIDVSGFDTSNAENMHCMFGFCVGLQTLDVSGFKTSKVTDMSYMFCCDRELKELNVSGFDTSNVTDMNNMFGSCSGLQSLDLTGFDMSKVKHMAEIVDEVQNVKMSDSMQKASQTPPPTQPPAQTQTAETKIDLDKYNLDTYRITQNDLNNMTRDDVRVIINALYAKHGYTFQQEQYARPFQGKSWYVPRNVSTEACEAEFNACETANKNLLVQYERDKGWR